eukprot:scaffold49028_cov44-Cyclotella_meneghiniana.AAC.1
MQFYRRSSSLSPPPSSRRANALLCGLSGINQALQQVGLGSPDPIGTHASSVDLGIVASPSSRFSGRPSPSSDPPVAPNNVSIDTGVDCRVPGCSGRDPAAVPASVDDFYARVDRSVASTLNNAFVALSEVESRQSRGVINNNEQVNTHHDGSLVSPGSDLSAEDYSHRRPEQEFSQDSQFHGSIGNNIHNNGTYHDSRRPFGQDSPKYQPPVGSGSNSRAESMHGGGLDPSRGNDIGPSGLPRTPWSRWPRDSVGGLHGGGFDSGGRGGGRHDDGDVGFGGGGGGRFSPRGSREAPASSPRASWSRSSRDDEDDSFGSGRPYGGRRGGSDHHGDGVFGSGADGSVRGSSGSQADGSDCLSPRVVPRDLSELPSSFVRVDKYKRAQLDFRALEKLRKDATAAPADKYLIGRLQVDHLLEEKTFENAQKLADHLAKSQLSLDKLRERAVEFDLTDSAVCYSTFDMSSPHKSGTKLDLFTEHDELDMNAVLEWQHWFLVWASDSDIQSGQWLSQLVLNSLKPDLRDEVSHELSDLPVQHRGSASTLWIALDKVNVSSYETTETLKSFITTFKLSAYPNENVRTACTQFKAILKALLAVNDIPTQAATTILAGFSTSSDKAFNTICDNLSLHERITSPRRRRRTISSSKSLYTHLVDEILPVLEDYHRDHELAGTWAGLGKPGAYIPASSAAFVTAPALLDNDLFCFNCGGPHDQKDCKEPNPNPNRTKEVADKTAQILKERERTFRGRRQDRSRSRGRSTSRPRDSSRRQQTPG